MYTSLCNIAIIAIIANIVFVLFYPISDFAPATAEGGGHQSVAGREDSSKISSHRVRISTHGGGGSEWEFFYAQMGDQSPIQSARQV